MSRYEIFHGWRIYVNNLRQLTEDQMFPNEIDLLDEEVLLQKRTGDQMDGFLECPIYNFILFSRVSLS